MPSPSKKTSTTPAATLKTPAKLPIPEKSTPARLPAAKKPATTGKSAAKTTTIVAKVDVGWGNSVYLRGQGGGLSWDVGVCMDCTKRNEWTWSCPAAAGPITFKFVRNDEHWAVGANLTVLAGANSVSSPTFPPW